MADLPMEPGAPSQTSEPLASRPLVVDGPWDADAAWALLVAHTIPGAETSQDHVHRRLLRIDGELVPVAVDLGEHPAVSAPLRHLGAVELVVRQWFELDADQGSRNHALATDPVLAPLVAARPGLRVTGHPDPFEALVGVVVGQQISLAAARTMTGRLVAAFGEPGPQGLLGFPTADALAGVGVDDLRAACGFMTSRARTLVTVAQAVAGGLRLEPGQDAAELAVTRRELLGLPGIGPWSVDFLCLRALRDPDSFPAGDLVLQRALGVSGQRAARDAAEGWRPHRSFAAMHLWTAAAYLA